MDLLTREKDPMLDDSASWTALTLGMSLRNLGPILLFNSVEKSIRLETSRRVGKSAKWVLRSNKLQVTFNTVCHARIQFERCKAPILRKPFIPALQYTEKRVVRDRWLFTVQTVHKIPLCPTRNLIRPYHINNTISDKDYIAWERYVAHKISLHITNLH